jgi:hypothetical protein
MTCFAGPVCKAGGDYKEDATRDGGYVAAVWTLQSGEWSVEALHQSVGIYSLSCGSPATCTATAEMPGGPYGTQDSILDYTSGSWAQQTTPLVDGEPLERDDVACPPEGACMIYLAHRRVINNQLDWFVVEDNAGQLSEPQLIPMPEGGTPGSLSPMRPTCPAANLCYAVGDGYSATSNGVFLTNAAGVLTAVPEPLYFPILWYDTPLVCPTADSCIMTTMGASAGVAYLGPGWPA